MASLPPSKPRHLLQQAEKILLQPIHAHLVTYCPTMDLIAVVTEEETVDVYRISGQRAFGLKRKSESVCVDALQWEFNGKSLAVSWSDGSMDIVGSETGKVGRRGGVVLDGMRVKCMGSGLNFIDVDAVKRRTGLKTKNTDDAKTDEFGQPTTEDWDAFKDDTTIEDFLQRQPDFQTLDIAPDLPDQLAMMDMETLLPKLPAIPLPPALPFMRAVAADAGAFSTQLEVDSLLHSHHLKDHNSVDMFIRCSDRGSIHPSIYDSMETVSVDLPAAWNITSTSLLHASHPYSCSHALLMRTTSPDQKSHISFVPLTLNFIPSAGIYLHLIASKTSQLQNLLLYITQCLQRIRTFFKHAQDLPRKFMLNISETLEEKGQGNLVTNLFHLACTGNCPPLLREWLVDELAEAGHKRWEATVSASLTTLLALLHENLLPAIDRCSIVISRLRGLAQFHDRDWIFTSPVSDFSALLDTLKNMRFLAHTALNCAGEEKRQFHAFSKWLRFCIDFEATEAESQSRADMEARDPGVDVLLVLEYIQAGLTKSALTPYFGTKGESKGEGDAPSYEDTKKAVEVLKEGGAFMPEALCLEYVLGYFDTGVTGVLKQVSKWMEGNIQMDGGVVLEEVRNVEEDVRMDMRMVHDPSNDSTSTYIALFPFTSTPSLHTHNLSRSPSSSSLTHFISTLSFPPSSKILDAKFQDDAHILILLHLSGKAPVEAQNIIISLPYTSNTIVQYTEESAKALQKRLLPSGTASSYQRTATSITLELIEQHTRHVFEGRFTPLKLVVNGRNGRRVIVVLGSDRKHYRVLDMDSKAGEGNDVDEEKDNADDVDMSGA